MRKRLLLRAIEQAGSRTKSFLFAVLCFASTTAFAQSGSDTRVTGRVTDVSGTPISNVSVTVRGGSGGTSTGADGTYAITVNGDASLLFSSVGYLAVTEAVAGRTVINVSLAAAVATGEQVVVVGYGAQRRRDVTGAVASVRGSELAVQPVQTATQAAQGKIAGVQVISSGEPNSLPNIRIRGTGSVLGGVNPLYVVDGVLTDDIRNINTSDILTFDVLKDASATAIYGVRGANGVIIITTKKGRPGKTVFNYTGTAAIKEATNLVDMAGEQQYAGYLNEANIYYGSGSNLIDPAKLVGNNTDWYDAILRRGFQQIHNLSMSGGSDKFLYYLSGGYLNEEGVLERNRYSRFTLRSNTEYIFNKYLRFNSQLSYTRGQANGPQFDAFTNAYRAAPYVISKTADGRYGNTSLAGNVANPLLSLEKAYSDAILNKIQGNFGIDLKPIAALTLRSAVNFELDYVKSRGYGYVFLPDLKTFTEAGGNQSRTNSTLSVNKTDGSRLIWDNTATYQKTFGKHGITALAGFVAEKQRFNALNSSIQDVPENRDQWYINTGTPSTLAVTNTGDLRTRLSYLGRLNYSFDNRYLLTATVRSDGSSNFPKNNRYATFPAVAVGWNISNESFMENVRLVNNLKLRASYGEKGNDNIPSSAFYQVAGINIPYYFPSGAAPSLGIEFADIIDRDLQWETTKEFNAGIDFSMFKSRLTGTLDYYDKKTDNALIFIELPGVSGDPSGNYLTNATSITNKGIELGLNWSDEFGKGWTYSIGGNISHNKNSIEDIGGGQPLFGDAVGIYRPTKSDNGKEIASYFVYKAMGIFQNQAQIDASAQPNARAGDLIYQDISGPDGKPDGKIDEDDRQFVGGSYQPNVTYGINGTIGFKGFDLSFTGYGTQGAKIYNGKKALRGTNQLTDNIEASVATDRWTPNNPNTGVPRATLEALPASTYFIENGDFFRLNNLTLGYNFNSKWAAKAKLSSARLYVAAQNLFTITPYSGFSPEVQTANVLNNGVDVNTYPTVRTFLVGLNIGF